MEQGYALRMEAASVITAMLGNTVKLFAQTMDHVKMGPVLVKLVGVVRSAPLLVVLVQMTAVEMESAILQFISVTAILVGKVKIVARQTVQEIQTAVGMDIAQL